MRKTLSILFAVSIALATVAPQPASALSDKEKNAIKMALALGLGIAAAKHGNNHDGNSQWDDDLYGQPFSPAPHVTCLPRPRKCYDRGHLSYRWTKRVFGA